ncbi:MAG: hypothetical protein NTZ74_09110 [Chloroflexi bacterium]|nr:hypothetical protein [Chloroflexota bacterium]
MDSYGGEEKDLSELLSRIRTNTAEETPSRAAICLSIIKQDGGSNFRKRNPVQTGGLKALLNRIFLHKGLTKSSDLIGSLKFFKNLLLDCES